MRTAASLAAVTFLCLRYVPGRRPRSRFWGSGRSRRQPRWW
ncbi:hypothetical protein [Rhodococcus sp. NPDC127527]